MWYTNVSQGELAMEETAHPVAMYGDWEHDPAKIGNLSVLVLNKYWNKVDTDFKVGEAKYTIIELKDGNKVTYNAGYTRLSKEKDSIEPAKLVFDVVFFIDLEEEKYIEDKLKVYPNLYAVSGVGCAKTVRGRGIAKAFYTWMVRKQKFNILSDTYRDHSLSL